MNRILLTIILLLPLTVQAQQDQSILFEIGVGFGTSTSTTSNACGNRSSDRPIFAAVRYRYDDVEIHGATWKGAGCNRDAIAVGVGYVIDTQGDGLAGRDDVYASWTPGVSYVWGQDTTTSRLENNVNMFNRVAIGVSDENAFVELAVNRYGRILKNYDTTGENFVSVGVGWQNLVNNLPTANTSGTETSITSIEPTRVEPVTGGTVDDDPIVDKPIVDDPPVGDDPYTPPGNGKNPGNKNDGKDGVLDGNAGSGNDDKLLGATGGDELGNIGKGNASDIGNEAAGNHPNINAR